jgi:ABC-type transporter Mla subunit MlaD
MGGRGTARSLAASPTMVGAITTLIVIVAVFLAYNANQGLPFVPTYRVSAEMCNAARLAPNNEVRIGGARAGVVESIETVPLEDATGCQTAGGSSASAAAKLNLKLEEDAKPLPEDSTLRVRYRSSFGLKYLEITRGTSSGLAEGGTLPIEQAEDQTEFDDIANTFDTPTRESSRQVLEGFGTGFAGRGESLNTVIEQLSPLFANLKPVSEALNDPSTLLVRFFPELGDAARLIAPVAFEQADLFTQGAIAFAAISSDPESLRDTISEGPETLETGIRSLPVQRPFLRDFAEFSRLLRPGVRDLRSALPVLNSAVSRGVKVLPRTVQMNNDLQTVMVELEELVDAPRAPYAAGAVPGQTATLTTLQRLGGFFDEATSAGNRIAPAQTICNYWNYWFQYLPEHFSGQSTFGLAERLIAPGFPGLTTPDHFPRNNAINYAGSQPDGRYSDFYDLTPATPPPKSPPAGRFDPLKPNIAPGDATNPADEVEMPIIHGNPYAPTGGSPSAPNCQAGQTGYAVGELLSPGQPKDSPAFGAQNIAAAAGVPPFGRTDLFLRQDGRRVFWDSP